jgi:shikimate dehydrogenase
MSGRSPALAVSLPADSSVAARLQVDASARAGANLAELRFDRWSPEALKRAGELFPSPLPLIATLRSRAEGGLGPDDSVSRREILLALAQFPFRWIDLESNRDLDLLGQLPPALKLGRILSVHFPHGVEPRVWSDRLRDSAPEGCLRKVVARASIGTFLNDLLPRIPPPDSEAVIALTTGPSGPLARAWARRLGLPIVFAAPPVSSDAPTLVSPIEPSQIPIDHLRPFLASEGTPPAFGLAGHPVAHSLSPSLHARWMARTNRSGIYVPLDFETETEFVDSLELLGAGGFRGLNVTHPWKAAALEAATDVAGGAEACGVANTLTFQGDEIEAENTDLAAILRRLEELRAAGHWDGSSLSIVGAGGAARATLAAARALGAHARIYARRGEAATELARRFGADARSVDEPAPDGLVIHATPAGRADSGPLGAPLGELVGAGTHVVDWVYAPERDEVRAAVSDAGGTYEDGRRLLVYQAAASFGVWWGEEPSPELVATALREEGCTE